jgi:hypothetical protein
MGVLREDSRLRLPLSKTAGAGGAEAELARSWSAESGTRIVGRRTSWHALPEGRIQASSKGPKYLGALVGEHEVEVLGSE